MENTTLFYRLTKKLFKKPLILSIDDYANYLHSIDFDSIEIMFKKIGKDISNNYDNNKNEKSIIDRDYYTELPLVSLESTITARKGNKEISKYKRKSREIPAFQSEEGKKEIEEYFEREKEEIKETLEIDYGRYIEIRTLDFSEL